MNLARCLPAASLVAFFLLTGCNKNKDLPQASASAAPASPAPPLAFNSDLPTGQVRMVLVPGSRASFLIDAPLEKIRGWTGGVEGTIDLDSMFLNMSKGSFTIDLDTFKTETFDDEAKNASQTEHMKNWLEIGPDVDDKLRDRNRIARFTITSIVESSVNNVEKVPSRDQQRNVTMKVNGNLLLHGISSPKTVDLILSFIGNPEDLGFLRIATLHPFTISLKEHDIKPRDLAGKFLAGALEKVGQKIDDTVQISLEFTAGQ
jgi:polyisoprenoid-binding protein YceI